MTYVLYHANCDDGFGAAWAAWKKFGDEAEYIPVQYGQEFPFGQTNDGGKIFIFDFSYPREVLEKVADRQWLKVLDHHKTAQADLEGLPFAYFDMDKSGAVLAWEYLFPSESLPKLLAYVQDRDLWRNELDNSEAMTSWRRAFRRDFDSWDRLSRQVESGDNEWISLGLAILQSEKIQIKNRIYQASEVDIGGHTVLAVNETQHFSEVAGELAKDEGYPFGACYFIRGDGVKQWSLRSVGDFDVSEVAKALGGGGHKNAAGFEESPE